MEICQEDLNSKSKCSFENIDFLSISEHELWISHSNYSLFFCFYISKELII